MTDGFLLRGPCEITFYNGPKEEGEKIHPKEIFRLMYSSLDSLIEKNRDMVFKRTGARNTKIKIHGSSDVPVPGEHEITADVRFDDDSRKEYKVQGRTNYDGGLLKRPNIVYLKGKDGSQVVLREARKHPLDELIAPSVRRVFLNKFDYDATEQFYRKGDTANVAPPINSHVMHIPEPNLLAALELMYAERRVSRVTPNIKVIDSDDRNMWYVRDFLNLVRDSSLDAEAMGKYFGIMHSLGLMEKMDRQIVHYCLIGENVGNYDPDFMLHSKSGMMVHDREMKDIQESIEDDKCPISGNPGAFMPKIKEAMKLEKKRAAEGVSNLAIFDYLSRDIETGHFSKVDLNI